MGLRTHPRIADSSVTVELEDLAEGLETSGAGGVLPAQLGLNARNESGGTLTEGTLVYVSGYSASADRPLLSKADADVAGAQAEYVVGSGGIANNANGLVFKRIRLTGLNANTGTVGDPVYLSATAGAYTQTAPTGTNAIQQIVGRLVVKSATVGEIEIDIESGNVVRRGTNELPTNAFDDTQVKNVAESDVLGGIPVTFMIPLAAGANTDTDVVVTHKIRVLNAMLILRGAGVATDVYTVKNGANAITDGMAASGADKAVVRNATLDDAFYEIAAGGTLRVTGSGGVSQPAGLMVVTGVRVA